MSVENVKSAVEVPSEKQVRFRAQLEENRQRRRVQKDYFKLDSLKKLWRIEGFSKANIYISKIRLAESVGIIDCQQTVVTIPGKCNHVLLNRVENVTVRVKKGVISFVELVNCHNVRLELTGSTPTIQIDLSSGVLLLFHEDPTGTKIVNASNTRISLQHGDAPAIPLDTDLFGEQIVSHLEDGQWRHLRASTLKEEGEKYLLISDL